jgi:ATP-dependent DNA ligase
MDTACRLPRKAAHAEWSKRLPGLVNALRAIPTKSVILDRELCLPEAGGVPDFIGLHLHGMSHGHELVVFAFDMLHRDGRDAACR